MSNSNTCININNTLYEETIICLADAYAHFKKNHFLERPKFTYPISNTYVMNCLNNICDMIIDGRDPRVLQIEIDLMINNAHNYAIEAADCLILIKNAIPALQEYKFECIDILVLEYGNTRVKKHIYEKYKELFD